VLTIREKVKGKKMGVGKPLTHPKKKYQIATGRMPGEGQLGEGEGGGGGQASSERLDGRCLCSKQDRRGTLGAHWKM